MNLLLLDDAERTLGARDRRAHHIRTVLRLSEGDQLRAGIIGGSVGTATIVSVSKDGITMDFRPERAPDPPAPVELLLGHPRPIVLRRMLRDLSALGLRRIVVVPTELGEKSYYASNLWDDVRTPLIEGAAQGGSTLVPELVRVSSLAEGIAALESPVSARALLHADSSASGPPGPTDEPVSLDSAFASVSGADSPDATRVAVAVGSERGWTVTEIDELSRAGFRSCSLGRRVLRTESAALIAVWAAIAWCEERR